MANVVSTVSWKTVPSNAAAPNDYKWLSSPNVVQRYVNASGFQPGDIVQMKLLKSGLPHTAFVVGVYYGVPGYIIWKDSNWFSRDYPEKVFQHTMSIPDFYAKVGTQYSVYNIQ